MTRKLGLNIGSFTVQIPSSEQTCWVNADILDLSEWSSQHGFEFQQFDIRKGIPWPDNSVDLIVCYHTLEHITRSEGELFLKECFRVLKPSGVLRIGVPDTQVIVKSYMDGKIHDFDANEGVKNAKDNAEAFWNLLTAGHLTSYDEDALANKMIPLGFTTYQCTPEESNAKEIITDTKDMYAGTDMLKIPLHTLYVEGIKLASIAAKISTPQPVTAVQIKDRVQWIREKVKNAKSIVDLGCFDAPATHNLQNCTWLDVLSYDQIRDLSKKEPPFPREKFIQSDAQRTPLKAKQFEVAILSEVLEHVALPVVALKEAARIADKVLITVPNESEWEPRREPFTNPGNARVYNEKMLREHLDQAGYRNYAVGRLDYLGWSFLTVEAETRTPETGSSKIKRLRIGLISTQFFGVFPRGYSGLEQIVGDLAVGLKELGHDVCLFIPEGGDESALKGIDIFHTGAALQTTNVDWLGAEESAYNKYRDELNKMDIIHGHNWFGFEYAYKANHSLAHVCHTHHGHLSPDWWLKNKPTFKLNFIGISEHMMKEYQAQGMPAKFVYNGINLDRYQFKKEKGDRLLFVGRLSPIKQPHVAIEIARKLGMGLDIVGGTFVAPQEVQYMEQIKAQCDGKTIVLYADATHEKKVELMQNARCLIFPSNMGEPFGLVAAESMSCGTPVVSTSDGAIGEVVENGVTGFVCHTLDEMINAVKKIDTISPETCRRHAEENFSRQKMAESYAQLYQDILEGREW